MVFTDYEETTLTRDEVDAMQGPVVIEFGASWCGICRGTKPHAEAAFEEYENVRHIRVEDGPGKKLGRSFKIKLWPTFVFMQDGKVVQTAVRPTSEREISEGLAAIAGNVNG